MDQLKGMREIWEGVLSAAASGVSPEPDRLRGWIRQCAQIPFAQSYDLAREQITAIITAPHPQMIQLFQELGISRQILPEFDEILCSSVDRSVGWHTLKILTVLDPEPRMRWAGLLHDFARPGTKRVGPDGTATYRDHDLLGARLALEILNRFGFEQEDAVWISTLIRWHDAVIKPTPEDAARAESEIGSDLFGPLLTLKRADVLAQARINEEALLDLEWIREYCGLR